MFNLHVRAASTHFDGAFLAKGQTWLQHEWTFDTMICDELS